MDNRVWQDQCRDCGKRFPSYSKLSKHQRRSHGSKIWCPVYGCNWSCSSHDQYRLRNHQRKHFVPAETPRPDYSVSSVVVPVGERVIIPPPKITTPSWSLGADTLMEMEQYDKRMPDFADFLNETRTPSPMRRLVAEDQETAAIPEDLATIPSDQLFGHYLTTATPTTKSKDPLTYSPSDPPFITDTITPEISTSTIITSSNTTPPPESPEQCIASKSPSPLPMDFSVSSTVSSTSVTINTSPSATVTISLPATINTSPAATTSTSPSTTTSTSPSTTVNTSPAATVSMSPSATISMSPSAALSIASPEIFTAPLDLSATSSFVAPSVKPLPKSSSPTSTNVSDSDLPLDLPMSKRKGPRIIPTESRTPVIDCTVPTGKWFTPARITLDQKDRLYSHLCLDPRVFFAGAPSHYLTHPLAKTLSLKSDMSRTSSASLYQRRLIPIGTKTIMKEEKCILDDGSTLELRDIWTSADSHE